MNRPEIIPRAPFVKPVRERFVASLDELGQNAVPTIASYWRMVRARKWLVLLLTLAAVVAAFFIVQKLTPIYRAKTILMVESSKVQVISIQDIYSGSVSTVREAIQTQMEYIRSRQVAERVVEKLKLGTHPLFDPRQQSTGFINEWSTALPFLSSFSSAAPAEPTLPPRKLMALVIEKLHSTLEINPLRQSQLIEVLFESSDPQLASDIANTLADSYIRSELDARFDMQQAASKWLSGRLDQLRVALDKSEDILQKYREEAGIIVTPVPSLGGTVRQLESATDRQILARISRAQAEQVFRQVRPGAPNRYQVSAVFNNPAVSAARQLEGTARQVLTERAQSLGTAHPLYKDALVQYEAAQENTRRQSEAVIASIAKEYEVARSTEEAIDKEVNDSRGSIRNLNRGESELHLLERDVETNRKLYETFLSRVKETNATSDFMTPVARIVDAAVAPDQPVKPRKSVYVALTAFLALLASSALAIGLELRSAVVRSVKDVDERLGTELLVAIPKAKRGQLPILHRIQHDDPRSLIAEAIRTALTDIRLVTHETLCPVIGFTSAVSGEGKSTIAINFAIEVSRRKRVLLIDADLRKPTIAKRMGLHPSTPGLSDLMQGASLESCMYVVTGLGFSLIPAGKEHPNPLDLLMSEEFRSRLQELRGMFDMIVVDTPPIELVSDALPIGRQCTGLIFVVRANETPIPLAKRGLNRIASADIPLFGVILNAHDFARASKYYGEYSPQGKYGYYNTYGTGNVPSST